MGVRVLGKEGRNVGRVLYFLAWFLSVRGFCRVLVLLFVKWGELFLVSFRFGDLEGKESMVGDVLKISEIYGWYRFYRLGGGRRFLFGV